MTWLCSCLHSMPSCRFCYSYRIVYCSGSFLGEIRSWSSRNSSIESSSITLRMADLGSAEYLTKYKWPREVGQPSRFSSCRFVSSSFVTTAPYGSLRGVTPPPSSPPTHLPAPYTHTYFPGPILRLPGKPVLFEIMYSRTRGWTNFGISL